METKKIRLELWIEEGLVKKGLITMNKETPKRMHMEQIEIPGEDLLVLRQVLDGQLIWMADKNRFFYSGPENRDKE